MPAGLIRSDLKNKNIWEVARTKYPVGENLSGKVIQHAPFGFFVDIGDPILKGIVQITDFRKEKSSQADFPSIGTEISAKVVAYTQDDRFQIWLTMIE